LNAYQWALIMVSHDQEFVQQIDGLETIDLGRLLVS
jgi:ATPase subunit of ABC transporter with duplicated ATPase domains